MIKQGLQEILMKRELRQVGQLYNSEYAANYARSDDQLAKNNLDELRYYAITINRHIKKFKKNRWILDVGCGTGRHWRYLLPIEKLVGIDLSKSMLRHAKINLKKLKTKESELVAGDIHQLDFAPASFQVIFSIGVLAEHSRLTQRLVNKIYRWLIKNGSIIITGVDASKVTYKKSGLRKMIEKMLPKTKRVFDWLIGYKYMTQNEAKRIFKKAGFNKIKFSSRHDLVHNHWVLEARK